MPTVGSTTARGYGAVHQRARKAALAELARVGSAPCTRCPRPVMPGQRLDYDHTDDRTGYLGLAHRACNRRAGVRKANRARTRRASRDWFG